MITIPHAGILGIGDIGAEADFFGLDVARITVVPEPATMTVLAIGAVVLAGERRRRRASVHRDVTHSFAKLGNGERKDGRNIDHILMRCAPQTVATSGRAK